MVDSLKVSELVEASNTSSTDLVDISQDQGGGSYISKKVQISNFKSNTDKSTFGFTTDAGVETISTGIKGYCVFPYSCTIKKWYLIADKIGSIVIDVWKANNSIPTVANTITGTEKPTLSSSQLNSDTNLTSWTTAISIGDVVAFNVDSASSVSRITLTIEVEK